LREIQQRQGIVAKEKTKEQAKNGNTYKREKMKQKGNNEKQKHTGSSEKQKHK
jgi:hypothetical protein